MGCCVILLIESRVESLRRSTARAACGCFRTLDCDRLVPDVAAFQGRVACDVVSKAEIAVPIISDRKVAAILDIDSTQVRGVDGVDQAGLEQISRFVGSRIGPIGWPYKLI